MSNNSYQDYEAAIQRLYSDYKVEEDEGRKAAIKKKIETISRQMQTQESEMAGDSYGELQSAGMGALTGITYGFADEIGAGLRTGFGYAGDYTAVRDSLRDEFAQAQSDNPKSYMAGDLATALVPGVGVANALGKAGRVGNAIVNKGSDFGRALKTGALEATATTMGESEDGLPTVGDTLKNAAMGAGVGGGLNLGAKVVKPVAGKVMEIADGLTSSQSARGVNRASKALKDDGVETLADARAMQERYGPEAVFADVGNNSRNALRESAQRAGPGARMAEERLRERNAGASGRVGEAVRDTEVGTSNTGKETIDRVEAEAKAQATPVYQEAYSRPLQPTKGLAELQANPAVRSATKAAQKRMAESADDVMGKDGPDAGETVRLLHYTIKELGDRGSMLQRSGKDAAAANLFELRTRMTNELKSQNKPFAEAQSIWADKSTYQRSIKDGKESYGSTERSQDTVNRYNTLSDADRQGFRLGVADEMQGRLERIKDTTTGQAQGVSNKVVGTDAERQLVREVFGGKGENLISVINREGVFKDTYNKALSGSDTQRINADSNDVSLNLPGNAAEALQALKSVFGQKMNDEGREAAVDALTLRISEMSDDEINKIINNGTLERMVSNVFGVLGSQFKGGEVSGRLSDNLLRETGMLQRASQ
jgi:hypothetical protein